MVSLLISLMLLFVCLNCAKINNKDNFEMMNDGYDDFEDYDEYGDDYNLDENDLLYDYYYSDNNNHDDSDTPPPVKPGLYRIQVDFGGENWHNVVSFVQHDKHVGTYFKDDTVSAELWQVTLVGRNENNEYLYNFREYRGGYRCMKVDDTIHDHEWAHVTLDTCDNNALSQFKLNSVGVHNPIFTIQSRANEPHFSSYKFNRNHVTLNDWFKVEKNGNSHFRFVED